MHEALLVVTMAVCTMLTRFLPFLVFRGQTPHYVVYLGSVLPSAIMGMLVVYCLRDVEWTVAPYGLVELVSVCCVVGLHVWRRNAILSILAGTAIYMVLIQLSAGLPII